MSLYRGATPPSVDIRSSGSRPAAAHAAIEGGSIAGSQLLKDPRTSFNTFLFCTKRPDPSFTTESETSPSPMWSKCVSCGAGVVLPGHGASTAPLGWRQWLRGGVRFTPWHRGRRGRHSRCVENGRQLRR